MSEYQEEVRTNLLDLQAELRGDVPEPHDPGDHEASSDPSPAAGSTASQETVAVMERGLTVSVAAPAADRSGVNERLAALDERLSQLEYDLARVTDRIERIEPEAETDLPAAVDTDLDAPWRSALDLQKIVANRLDTR